MITAGLPGKLFLRIFEFAATPNLNVGKATEMGGGYRSFIVIRSEFLCVFPWSTFEYTTVLSYPLGTRAPQQSTSRLFILGQLSRSECLVPAGLLHTRWACHGSKFSLQASLHVCIILTSTLQCHESADFALVCSQ